MKKFDLADSLNRSPTEYHVQSDHRIFLLVNELSAMAEYPLHSLLLL